MDDTAKGILALILLDHPQQPTPDAMIKVYEAKDHFTTFGSERDPSFTSNCHVLMALLHLQDAGKYTSQIIKTANFLVNWWWNNDYRLKDKWVGPGTYLHGPPIEANLRPAFEPHLPDDVTCSILDQAA